MKKKTIFVLFMTMLLVIATVIPQTAFASEELDDIEFLTSSDYRLTTGVSTTINFKLYDDNGDLFTGSVTAILYDSDGKGTSYMPSGSSGYYSINNVTVDVAGDYDLVVESSDGDKVTVPIEVADPGIDITGSLIINDANPSHKITIELGDAHGEAIRRQSVTIDGTSVGAGTLSLTTDYLGKASFSMTPTMFGNADILLEGHIIGTIPVVKAYTEGERIGENGKGSAGLSVAVAEEGWESSSIVILTRDDILADAMAAVPLSKKLDAPILMTSSSSLDSEVLSKIQELGASQVFIIGGAEAISKEIEASLSSSGLTISRLSGKNRYDTAAQIAAQIGSADVVYMTYGHGEADAMAISSFAAAQGSPILLTDQDTIPGETLAALKTVSPHKIILIGGTGIISPNIEKQLAGNYTVERWGGTDRYNTEQIILENLLDKQSARPVYFASALVASSDVSGGKPFGDALLASALAAKNNGFVIVVPQNTLPSSIQYFLSYNKGYLTKGTVVGSTSAISRGLQEQLSALIEH